MSLHIIRERLRNRFWLIPTLIVLILIATLALSLQVPEKAVKESWADLFLHGYSTEGARLILSSIATALMTVIGVLFSLTIVVLQQVSSQYSPRVIERFIKSYSSQIMLGMYVGTFVYCILLLRQVPSDTGKQTGIPQLSITIALGLALTCIYLLIQYIHHVAQAIKSTDIIASLKNETISHLEGFAEFLVEHRESSSLALHYQHHVTLKAPSAGYVQSVQPRKLLKSLKQCHESFVELRVRIGDYVQEGDIIAAVHSIEPIEGGARARVAEAFDLGSFRTHAQDLRYGLQQLVDISLRALSPSINDPSTAIEAVNALSTVMARAIDAEPLPNRIRLDANCTLEFLQLRERDLIEVAYNQIAYLGRDHVPLLARLRIELSALRQKLSTDDGRKAASNTLILVEEFISLARDSILYERPIAAHGNDLRT